MHGSFGPSLVSASGAPCVTIFFFLEKIRFRSQLNLQEEKIIHPVCGCSTYAYTHIPTWGAYHSTNATLHLDAGYRRPENLVPEHEVEALN